MANSLLDSAGFRLLRKIYVPYEEPLSRKDFDIKAGSVMVMRLVVAGMFGASQYDGSPLESVEDRLAFFFRCAPLLGVFWGPYITLICRRLQGIGVATPYLGWAVLGCVVLLYAFLDVPPLARDIFSFRDIILLSVPLVAVALQPDDPMYGVGVFTGRAKSSEPS